MPMLSTGIVPGAGVGGGVGGGAALAADAASFAVGLAAGARIAALSQPFGAGTGFVAVGSVPPALALDTGAGAVVAGGGAASGGSSYAIKVRATSADGRREVAETLSFAAVGSAGAAGPAALPLTPAARWHPAWSTVATAGGRVTAASDLQGLAAVSEGAAGIGPRALTDAAGRAFWRFEGTEYLTVANSLVADQRAVAVFMVGRHHRAQTANFFGLGSVAGGTAGTNTLGTVLNTSTSSGIAPHLRGTNISAGGLADTALKARMVLGSQLQLLGVASRPTAAGGQRLIVNEAVANVAQAGAAATGIAGAEIGRYPYAPGTSTNWGLFDLYEMVVFTRVLSDAEADAVAAALRDAWAIPAVAHQLVVEGDSITQGVGDIRSGESLGMLLGAPGASALPAGWRVINAGVSGAQTSNLVTRRDGAGGLASNPLAGGRNVVAVQIGRNNLGLGGQTGQQVYDAIVALHRGGGTGWLDRGWEVRQAVNIAVSSSSETQNTALRGLLRAGQFLSDLQAAAGQPGAGKVGLVDLPLVTVAGSGTIFDTVADATDPMWYQGDATHPTAAATAEIARAYRASL